MRRRRLRRDCGPSGALWTPARSGRSFTLGCMTCRRHAVVSWLVGAAVALGSCGEGHELTDGTAVPSSSSIPLTASETTSGSAPAISVGDRQEVLDSFRDSYGAPGAIALLRDGETEWRGVSGVADVSGTEIDASTRFRVASITKPIVAFLVLDAVDRGELSLDDTVGDLLPGVVRAEPPITVRMLLDHTSGIFNVGDEGDIVADVANLTDPALQAEAADVGTRYLAGEHVSMSGELYVALAETHDRYFEPGTGYHYSNPNYQLAAMVLERVTGTPLAELLRARLVDMLGLDRTTIAPDDAGMPDLHGYGLNPDGSLVDLTSDFLALGNGGSGGVISTADELLTIMQSIVSGTLLPPPLVADMKQPSVPSDGQYGLGLARYPLSCGTFYGHAGATSGTHSIALVNDDGTTGTVVVVNLRGAAEPNLLATAETLLCAAQ
jgi:D-alanyl-D-alanine carboxypeptidase